MQRLVNLRVGAMGERPSGHPTEVGVGESRAGAPRHAVNGWLPFPAPGFDLLEVRTGQLTLSHTERLTGEYGDLRFDVEIQHVVSSIHDCKFCLAGMNASAQRQAPAQQHLYTNQLLISSGASAFVKSCRLGP
jgi:hypothetical protein